MISMFGLSSAVSHRRERGERASSGNRSRPGKPRGHERPLQAIVPDYTSTMVCAVGASYARIVLGAVVPTIITSRADLPKVRLATGAPHATPTPVTL